MEPEKSLTPAELIAATVVMGAGAIAGTMWLFGAVTLGEAAPAVFIAIGFDFALKMLARTDRED